MAIDETEAGLLTLLHPQSRRSSPPFWKTRRVVHVRTSRLDSGPTRPSILTRLNSACASSDCSSERGWVTGGTSNPRSSALSVHSTVKRLGRATVSPAAHPATSSTVDSARAWSCGWRVCCHRAPTPPELPAHGPCPRLVPFMVDTGRLGLWSRTATSVYQVNACVRAPRACICPPTHRGHASFPEP